jgi:retinol dehydrogenase 12
MRAAKETVALVTGANSGIGKAIAKELAAWGAHVVLVVRNADKGKAAIAEIRTKAPNARLELLLCDLASQSSIRTAAQNFLKNHKELHILVNAAGVFMPQRVVNADGLETTFATNYLAYWLLTNQLVPALKKGAPSRVVNVASRYGGAKLDLEDLQFERRKYSYMKSTPPTMLARILFTQELAERLKQDGITVNALHPGLVANTQLLNETRGFFRWFVNRVGTTPEKGADTAVWLATSPEAAKMTGQFVINRKPAKTSGQASDAAFRKRLWETTEKIVAPRKATAG